MALTNWVIKWFKAEDFTAEVGSVATEVGTVTTPAAKFNNGWYSNNNANYTESVRDGLTPDEWMVEMWVKPDGNCTNGVIDNAGVNGNCFFTFWLNNNNRIHLTQEAGVLGHGFIVRANGVTSIIYFTPADLDYAAGSLNHYLWVYKRGTIGATANTIRLYFNGTLVGTSNVVPNAWVGAGGDFTFLNHSDHTRTIKMVEDNIKVYSGVGSVTEANITKALDNREFEGFTPDTPTGLAASDGTYDSHVQIDWDAMDYATSYEVWRSSDGVTFYLLSSPTTNTYNDSSAIAGVTYYYKVLAVSASGSSALSAADSGFRAIKIFDLTCDKNPPQILILSGTKSQIDLYQLGYISTLPKITEEKSLGRDKFITNSITLIAKNFDNFFSIYNSRSIFSNIRWLYESLTYINVDDETRWDGILADIRPDHNTQLSPIKSKNQIFKERQNKISYQSPSNGETPASAFKNLADQEGFTDYDMKSVEDSINRYNNFDGSGSQCLIKCDFNTSDGITLQQAFEKIAVYGGSDIFGFNNKIYIDLWRPFTGGIKVTINESDFIRLPKLSSSEPQLTNDYSINYNGDGDVAATDNDNNDIGSISRQSTNNEKHLLQIDGSVDQQIVIMDLTSAVFIGETYIRRSHRNLETNPKALTIIDFQVNSKFREWIDLTSFFNVNLSDEEWISKPFETIRTTIDDNTNIMTVRAREVDNGST